METLGSPSISRATMSGAMLPEYRKLVYMYADDRYMYNDSTTAVYYRSLTCVEVFLRLSREKSVKFMCHRKIYIKMNFMHKTNHD